MLAVLTTASASVTLKVVGTICLLFYTIFKPEVKLRNLLGSTYFEGDVELILKVNLKLHGPP